MDGMESPGAPGSSQEGVEIRAAAVLGVLLDRLADPDAAVRAAVREHVLRVCVPAAVAYVVGGLVDRVAAGEDDLDDQVGAG